MAAVGVDLEKARVALGVKGLEDLLRHRRGPDGEVGAGEPLGQGHDVRPHPVEVGGEHLPRAPEAGDHLVADHEHPVAGADLAHALQVVRRGRDDPPSPDDGLGDEGRHRIGPLVADDGVELLGAARGELLLGPGPAAVEVGGLDVDDARQQGLELPPPVGLAGQARPADGGPVVALVAGDDLVAAPPQLAPGAGDLEGGVHRLRAAVHEPDPAHPLGEDLRQLGREPGGGRVDLGEGVVGELEELPVGGLGHLLAAVADVHAPEARHGVDVALAAGVGDGAPARLDHDAERALGQGAVVEERVPDVRGVLLPESGHLPLGPRGCGIHASSPINRPGKGAGRQDAASLKRPGS